MGVVGEAPVPGFIRDAQRRAAAAASTTPNPSDLLAKRLRREGWSERAIEDHEKTGGAPAALLYSLLKVEGGVDTPKGQGTLYSAYSSGCLVLLNRQKATAELGGGKKYRPLSEFDVNDVTPHRKGR